MHSHAHLHMSQVHGARGGLNCIGASATLCLYMLFHAKLCACHLYLMAA